MAPSSVSVGMNTMDRFEAGENFPQACEEMGEENYLPQPYAAEAPEELDAYPF